ncbi:MAG: CapA family protein [Spirochaetaceae bacterium]|nr:MAG: CapA family protein [Spirochaetaceae bacterium]
MRKKSALIIILALALQTQAFGQNSLSLSFVGDIMAHDVNFQMYDFSEIYRRVSDVFLRDDLTFGNLEFPIIDDMPFSTYPIFNVKQAYVQAAVTAGFDVFSLANNHITDKGDLGVLKTLTSLLMLKERADGRFFFSGIRGNPQKPFVPEVIYRNGFKIGFIAATQFLNNPQYTPYVNVVDIKSQDRIDEFLAWVKTTASQYDLFIVSFHGDIEYVQTPDSKKQRFFRQLIEAGADIVWGHHPHVLQPYELVKINGQDKLIMYSTGNFISGQTSWLSMDMANSARAFTGDSAIFQVRVTRHGNSSPFIAGVIPILISNYKNPEKGVIVDRTELLAGYALPGNWQEYFRTRLSVMRDFFNNMANYINKE